MFRILFPGGAQVDMVFSQVIPSVMGSSTSSFGVELVEAPLVFDNTTDGACQEAGVGGITNPSASRVYSIFGADFASLLGMSSPSECPRRVSDRQCLSR